MYYNADLSLRQPLTLWSYGFLFSFNSRDLARVSIAALVDQASLGECDSAASGGRDCLLHDSSYFEHVLIITSNSWIVNHFLLLLCLLQEHLTELCPLVLGQEHDRIDQRTL